MLVRAVPPRIPEAGTIDHEALWACCVEWVKENIRLVGKTMAPYRRFLCLEQEDLYHLSYLAAYESIETTVQQGRHEDFMVLFIGKLKNAFRLLASGPPTITVDNLENLSVLSCEDSFCGIDGLPWPTNLSSSLFYQEAAPHMTPMQQNLWEQFLFGCERVENRRELYRMLNRGVQKVLRAKQGRAEP